MCSGAKTQNLNLMWAEWSWPEMAARSSMAETVWNPALTHHSPLMICREGTEEEEEEEERGEGRVSNPTNLKQVERFYELSCEIWL